jgi:hypothetical protein
MLVDGDGFVVGDSGCGGRGFSWFPTVASMPLLSVPYSSVSTGTFNPLNITILLTPPSPKLGRMSDDPLPIVCLLLLLLLLALTEHLPSASRPIFKESRLPLLRAPPAADFANVLSK